MNTRQTNWRFWLSLAIMVLLVPLAVVLFTRLKQSFYLSGLTIIVLTIAAFFLHFESRKPQARELVLLAVLCALAVASRAAFGFVPHFKPMLAIVMLTGIAFGPEAGFLCGAISGFASNFIFGQGPWTPWQMFAYGIGGMLAGHEESGGTVVEENGEKFMLFYGMSSESAMTRHVGGVAKYRAAEGKTVKLPLRGPVDNTARDILGGLRSACTYVGASRLKELTKRTTFIRVQEQENRVFNSL